MERIAASSSGSQYLILLLSFSESLFLQHLAPPIACRRDTTHCRRLDWLTFSVSVSSRFNDTSSPLRISPSASATSPSLPIFFHTNVTLSVLLDANWSPPPRCPAPFSRFHSKKVSCARVMVAGRRRLLKETLTVCRSVVILNVCVCVYLCTGLDQDCCPHEDRNW